MRAHVFIKKIKSILYILPLLCSILVSPAFGLETVSPVEPSVEQDNIEQTTDDSDDMFAPVELDLTDYSYMNDKKNKKFELSATQEGKPA